jgi:uncharacterized protein (DUF58 family)
MRPTWRAVLLAGLGVAVALLPAMIHPRLWPLWTAFLGAFVLALGADALLAPRRRDLAASMTAPDALYLGREGQQASIDLRFPTLQSRREIRVRVAADLSGRLVPQAAIPGAASRDGGIVELPLVPTRRGRAVIERLWVRWQGPLRLMAAVTRIELNREMAVVTDLQPVRAMALRLADPRDFRAGLKIERYRGDGTQFDSLREHVLGDDSRSIDWKTSAHYRKLVTRQFRAERNHQILIAVDTGHLMSEPLSGIPKLDHAIQAGLLLSYLSLRVGDRVGWMTFDARVGLWIEPQTGTRGFHALSHAASRIEYTGEETNFTLGLTSLAQRLSRRSLIVVLTDFVDTVSAELMVENLDRLSRRHALVFVALRDPDLAEAAARPPDDLEALNRAVVAGTLLRDRDLVLRRLARLGVRAVDAAPAQVNPWLLNTYLEMKRREVV